MYFLPNFSNSQELIDANKGCFQNYDLHEPISFNDQIYDFYHQNQEEIIPDFPDACLKFMNDILMEEDMDDDGRLVNLQDHHALQATEKSFYDVLGETYPPSSSDQPIKVSDDQSRCLMMHHVLESSECSAGSSSSFNCLGDGFVDSPVSTLFDNELNYVVNSGLNRVYKEKNRNRRENVSDVEERSAKQVAASNEEYAQMEEFDDVLISKEGNDDISPCVSKSAVKEASVQDEKPKGSKSKRKSRAKKKTNKEMVDLRTLMTQCAEAIAGSDFATANELLKQIRQHATPFGDSAQRVAHYFANGLEARMNGTGSELYRASDWKRFTPSDILRGYKLYVSAIPFMRASHYLANQTIVKLAEKAPKIHIIDFGIFLGFQWPCLIQTLSRRPLGPPRLKITGVDNPQSGFKPAKMIEETGRRLAGYCERFGVPFEFQGIAQKWHTVNPDDLNIQKDELVIVSCLFRSKQLPDESVEINSPRDGVLKLIRSLNPDLFIHGVINGTFNAPFFITRFREALYHYSSLFDVFEATMLHEDQERQLIENYLYGKDAMNIVACEGSERIERPETYKQWQVRHQRTGFVQVQWDQAVVNRARAMVRANYHKDFMLEQDKYWMVQGWKGRVINAMSCWKPA
ncbi:unnamed protein product [Amaranthus hypochondriacus]